MNDQKVSIYEEITARIITALENGVNPWAKPWQAVHYGPFRNALFGVPSCSNEMQAFCAAEPGL